MRPSRLISPLALIGCALGCGFGCGFSGSATLPGEGPIDGPTDGSSFDPPWWNTEWSHRRQVTVTTGPLTPDKGYVGYTAYLTTDTTGWPVQADCRDLRLLVWSAPNWKELSFHRVGCGAGAEVRFAIPVELAAGASWTGAYLYYGNAGAVQPLAVSPTSVYLWWDDATVDRSAEYVRGRMDPWQGTGHTASFAWNAAGYYTYNNGNDAQESVRRAVDERDVLVEAEWQHRGCYINNIQSGVCLRGIIATGAGATENADHYYCSSRAHHPDCNTVDDGLYDGDIVKSDNQVLAVNNPQNPGALSALVWRKQALAAYGTNPTHLRFWDANTPWLRLGAPPTDALLTSGDDATDYEMRGFAGIMTSQDIAWVKGLIIRRYVEPEPTVTLGAAEAR
ncbi:MAG: hypothetical protein IPI49_24930 [Myxococcales bacterium]|nr:hypothetical protein [Myxococcales bacterium]